MPVQRRFMAEGREVKAYDEKYDSYALKWLQKQVEQNCGAVAQKAKELLFDKKYWEEKAYKTDVHFKSRILEMLAGRKKGEDSTSSVRYPHGGGSYTKDHCEFRFDFLSAVVEGNVDLDWFPCGLPCVRNMEKDPRKVDKPEPIIDDMIVEALIWGKMGPKPRAAFLCCVPAVESVYSKEEYATLEKGLWNMEWEIRSGYPFCRQKSSDYDVMSPAKGVGRVEGSSLLDCYCRAVTTSMDGYGDVISEASNTRRRAAEAFDEKYCKGTDGVWRSKVAEADRIERIRKGGSG